MYDNSFSRAVGSWPWEGTRLREQLGSQPSSGTPPSKQPALACLLISPGFHPHATADLLPALCSTHPAVEKPTAGDPSYSAPWAG